MKGPSCNDALFPDAPVCLFSRSSSLSAKTNVQKISADEYHTAAVREDGTVVVISEFSKMEGGDRGDQG